MFLKIRHICPIICLLVATAIATINQRKPGWLDRVVQYRKDKFIKDVQMLPAVEIHARIEPAPPGFEDSKNWDFESVMRLLGLLRQSETGREVHRALRRSMKEQPNRRIYMSFMDTFKYFPRIHHENYYDESDMESLELVFDSTPHSKVLDDNDVIIVSNPVEARLPSTKISVKMLRTILEERAFAARIMPPTTRARIDWKPMNKTATTGSVNATESGNATQKEDGGNGNSTSPSDADSGSTVSPGNTTDVDEGSTNATVSEADPTSSNAGRRHVMKGKGKQQISKPVRRGRVEPPRQNKPILRQKSKRGTKRRSRKAAPKSKKLYWGR